MTHFRAKNTAQFVCIAAAAFALIAGCGDDDSGSEGPSAEGGDGGEPVSSAGKTSTGGSGGSGGTAPVNHAGEMNPPEGGEGGQPPQATELGWSSRFGVPGVSGYSDGNVNSLVLTGVRKLWAGGKFTLAGDVPASNVAIWNGQRWGALGEGLPAPVRRLAATPDENVYALLEARDAGAQLFYWDGESWAEVDTPADKSIRDIAVGPDGTLYAIRTFSTETDFVTEIAAQEPGEAWQVLPSDPEVLGDGGLDTIAAFEDRLCVGGLTGSVAGGGVSCLEDDAWISYRGNIAFGGVESLVEADGTLYAGGGFTLEGIDTGGGVAKWTGEAWELIGGGLTYFDSQPYVHAIAVDQGKVYATGLFDHAAGLEVRSIAMFDGEQWSDLNGGLQKWVGADFGEPKLGGALAVDDGGEVYVGGSLTVAGTEGAFRLASWDGTDWHSVDDPQAPRLGVNGLLETVLSASDGSVYVGGKFRYLSGQIEAPGIARFEPSQSRWLPLGLGLNGDVLTLAEQGGSVFAGGAFNKSGNASVKSIARWDGVTWRSVGGGTNGYVNTLLTGPDDKLYAAGGFYDMGGEPAHNVAVWDGTAWSALDAIGEEGENVSELAFDADGTLYAGGNFSTASGAPASNIAVWQDDAWAQLGSGLDGIVTAMTFYDGKIVAGGYFTHSGSSDVPHLAYWDAKTERFEPLGGGLVPPDEFGTVVVNAFAVRGKDLYVGGIILAAGGKKTSHIVRYDGKTWHDVDGGCDDVVSSLTLGKDVMWVGGYFARAGAYGSVGIARYGFAP